VAKRKGLVLGYRVVGAVRLLPAAPKAAITAGKIKASKGTAVLPVKNTGNTDLVFLEIFRADRFEDVSLSDWLTHAPRSLVAQHLNVDPSVIARFPNNKPLVLPV